MTWATIGDKLEKAMESYFIVQMAAQEPTVNVEYPNVPIETEGIAEWLRVFTSYSDSFREFLTGSQSEGAAQIGEFIVDVFVRPKTGPNRSRQIADKVYSWFKEQQISLAGDDDIVFGIPTFDNVGHDGHGWWMRKVKCPWKHTDRDLPGAYVGFPDPVGPFGSGYTLERFDIPSEAVDGARTIFTTAYTYVTEHLEMFANGLKMPLSVYSESGVNEYTFTSPPEAGKIVAARYWRRVT